MNPSPPRRQPPDPEQVRQVQRILRLPETGKFCRATIIAAAKHTGSWHRGPSLIGQVLEHRTSNAEHRTSK